jgi:hypothetical protein
MQFRKLSFLTNSLLKCTFIVLLLPSTFLFIFRLTFDGVQSALRLGPFVKLHVGDSKNWGCSVPHLCFTAQQKPYRHINRIKDDHIHFTNGARVWSQASPSEICVEQSSNRTGFTPNTSVFACEYHSTYSPHSYFIRLQLTLCRAS